MIEYVTALPLLELLFLLAVGHALADYPLQGDFLARAKEGRVPGVSPAVALFMHSLIHGGLVAYVVGIWWIGVLELVAHYLIDTAKLCGSISFRTDQTLHLACKLVWAVIAVWGFA